MTSVAQEERLRDAETGAQAFIALFFENVGCQHHPGRFPADPAQPDLAPVDFRQVLHAEPFLGDVDIRQLVADDPADQDDLELGEVVLQPDPFFGRDVLDRKGMLQQPAFRDQFRVESFRDNSPAGAPASFCSKMGAGCAVLSQTGLERTCGVAHQQAKPALILYFEIGNQLDVQGKTS